MSLERLEVAASGLSFVMSSLPLLSVKKGRNRIKSKEKGGRRDKNLEIQKQGRKDTTKLISQHNSCTCN